MAKSDVNNESLIYQCKISLKGLIPPIWRQVRVSGDIPLDKFHRVLQKVMGWGNYQNYRFIIEGAIYGPSAEAGPSLNDAAKVSLSQVSQVEGSKFIYVYDLADDWQHVVKVERILPPEPGIQYPICLAGQRACPPEECGGIWEYSNLLEIFKNPRHPEHRDMIEQFGGDFDPEAFDIARINRALQPIRGTKTKTSPVNNPPVSWSEADSKLYQEIAAVAVPAREEQMAALLTLLPFGQDEPFRAVELGCGEGFLCHALLDCFSEAEVVALDGSGEMLAQTSQRLSRFDARAAVAPFDLFTNDWLAYLQGADCIVSSLVLHHLDDAEKQALFAAIAERLSPRGVFLIADLVHPPRPEAGELFAATWDRSAEAQALAQTGSRRLFEQFVQAEWNLYRFPDPVDKPSPLFEQLTWLKTAGFAVADCFWLQAGHAIYGGYKAGAGSSAGGVSFAAALRSAQVALRGMGNPK